MTPSVDNIEFNSNKDPKIDCEKLGLNWIDVAPEVDAETINLLDAELAVRLRVLPIAIESGRLSIAMLNPTDIEASDEVATITAYPITRCGMDKQIFSELMRNYYGTTAARMAESLGGAADEADTIDHNVDAIETDNILVMAEQPTLINLVNLLLLEAIQQRASDVHIEPFENELKAKVAIAIANNAALKF